MNKYLGVLLLLLPFFLTAQTVSIPDPEFEQFLIDDGIDSDTTINGEVLLSDVSSVPILFISDYDISNLEGLQFFSGLTNFTLYNNTGALLNIDFSQNVLLDKIIIIDSPFLNSIDINSNILLEELQLNTGNEGFSVVDVSSNINLTLLNLADNGINSVNVSNNTQLISLVLSGNPITSIDVTELPELQILLVHYTQLTSIDVSSNPFIRDLWVNNCNLINANLKNGFNQFMTSVLLDGNPSLSCVEVDDVAYANTATGWLKDATADYANNCNPITINSYPYIEDFESGANGWSVNGYNPSWELNVPNGNFIQGAASGSNAWVTNAVGPHNQWEESWVESPTFDLSSLNTPHLQIDIWWECGEGINGALIQSTFDNGLTWQNLGFLNDQPNWYNNNNINSEPGGSNVGWSGNGIFTNGSLKWLRAYQDLSHLAGPNNVKFRVVFASNGFNFGRDGFAFDTFSILEEPCFAGNDMTQFVLGCELESGIVNLNSFLTEETNANGVWEALDGVAVSVNGDIDFTGVSEGNYDFQYSVSTEGGACTDVAIITIDFQETLSAGTSTEIETCGGDEYSSFDMFDFIGLYFDGLNQSGVWTDSGGFEVEFPIFPSDGDVYTYTHAANGDCPEVSSTVTFIQPPILSAGETPETEDLGCNPPEFTIELNSKLVNADIGGEWRNAPDDSGDIEIVSSTGDGGEPIDEVDFGTLGAGSYYFRFEYAVPDDCGLSESPTAIISFEIAIFDSQAPNVSISFCEDDLNQIDIEQVLDFFVQDDGTGLWSWDYFAGPGNYGDIGVYQLSNGCGEPSGFVNVYLNALRPKVFLQGALLNPNVGEEHLMRDDLRVMGQLPSQSPYADGSFVSGDPFSVSGENAIVDWVLVELRDEESLSTVMFSQSALLQRDGDVVGLDGVSALCFKEEFSDTGITGNYFLSIKHRNHLAIMTENPVAIGLSFTELVVDFTDANNSITYGIDAQTNFGMPDNKLGMWAGDVDGNGVIQYVGAQAETPSMLSFIMNHPSNTLNLPTWTINEYNDNPFDVDLNGTTQYVGSDSELPFILQNIFAFPGNTFNLPTWVIEQQLPD